MWRVSSYSDRAKTGICITRKIKIWVLLYSRERGDTILMGKAKPGFEWKAVVVLNPLTLGSTTMPAALLSSFIKCLGNLVMDWLNCLIFFKVNLKWEGSERPKKSKHNTAFWSWSICSNCNLFYLPALHSRIMKTMSRHNNLPNI